ncbi:MAG TPA: nucleoside triphosphate pyrophosphohydrolase family protein [Azospirillaceae bacterium]|nr:nucleoside triphosphate pyrophosphohydrolase family protein [Azospirillaceae bacterium]
MDIEDYAAWAAALSGVSPGGCSDRERLSYLGLGLAGEAGEVADHVKKLLRDGDTAWRPEQVADELGDVAYYWAALCVAVGRSPAEVLAASHAKITAKVAAARRLPET